MWATLVKVSSDQMLDDLLDKVDAIFNYFCQSGRILGSPLGGTKGVFQLYLTILISFLRSLWLAEPSWKMISGQYYKNFMIVN